MPRVNIYIRKEDYATWTKIRDKPAFIHDAIHVQNSLRVGTMYPKGETKVPGGKVIVSEAEINGKKYGPVILGEFDTTTHFDIQTFKKQAPKRNLPKVDEVDSMISQAALDSTIAVIKDGQRVFKTKSITSGKTIPEFEYPSKAPDMLTQEARYGGTPIDPKELEPPIVKTVDQVNKHLKKVTRKIADGYLPRVVDDIGKEFIGPIPKSFSARKKK